VDRTRWRFVAEAGGNQPQIHVRPRSGQAFESRPQAKVRLRARSHEQRTEATSTGTHSITLRAGATCVAAFKALAALFLIHRFIGFGQQFLRTGACAPQCSVTMLKLSGNRRAASALRSAQAAFKRSAAMEIATLLPWQTMQIHLRPRADHIRFAKSLFENFGYFARTQSRVVPKESLICFSWSSR